MALSRFERSIKREALLASSFFQSMRADELDVIVGFAKERRVPRGATIFSKGEAGSSLMAVLAGRVRVVSISAEGKEVTLNLIGPGEIFGEIALLDGKPRSADAVAAEDAVLLVVERRDFMPFLLRHEHLIERLLAVLCDRLRRTSLALEEMALLDMPARLARVLLTLAEDYGRPDPEGGLRVCVKMSQEELGRRIGGRRESVNKLEKAWKASGVLERREGYLVIRDAEQLRKACG